MRSFVKCKIATVELTSLGGVRNYFNCEKLLNKICESLIGEKLGIFEGFYRKKIKFDLKN